MCYRDIQAVQMVLKRFHCLSWHNEDKDSRVSHTLSSGNIGQNISAQIESRLWKVEVSNNRIFGAFNEASSLKFNYL